MAATVAPAVSAQAAVSPAPAVLATPTAAPSQSWTLSSPASDSSPVRTYSRALHGVERLWAYAHANLGGAFDMVSLFRPSQQTPTTLAGWQAAWKRLCEEEPILACRLDRQGSSLVAEDFGADEGAWKSWQEENVVLVSDTTDSTDPAPLLDHCLKSYDFDAIKLVVFTSPGTNDVHHIAITNNHALADAGAVIRLALRLLCLAEDKQASTGAATPQASFTERLPFALADACGYTSDPSQVPAMLKEATKPSHGLSVVPLEKATAVSGPWRQYKTFDAATTSAIIKRCKAQGITIASFAQAVVAHASLRAHVPTEGDEPHPFSVAAMPFSKMADVLPQHRRDGCFMAMAMNPISFQVDRSLSLLRTSRAVQQSFASAKEFPAAAQEGFIQTLVKFYGAMKAGIMPSPTSSFPTLSSLGNVDATVKQVLASNPSIAHPKLIDEYQIGSRNPQATMGVHVWTLNGKLTVSLAWNPARFDAVQISTFWDAICELLEGNEL